LPGMRLESPLAYWLIAGPRASARAEIVAFCSWVQAQAALTRLAIGDVTPVATATSDTPAKARPGKSLRAGRPAH
jgi:LysR family glycine cleavage system transcriptional activator